MFNWRKLLRLDSGNRVHADNNTSLIMQPMDKATLSVEPFMHIFDGTCKEAEEFLNEQLETVGGRDFVGFVLSMEKRVIRFSLVV